MDQYHDNEYTASRLRHRWNTENADSKPLSRKDLYRALRRQSLIERLRRRAMVLAILGCCGPFLIITLAQMTSLSVLLQVVYSIFMLACASLSFYWWYRLGKVYHYMSIPLIEAQQSMERLDRLRRNIKIGSWITGIPVIAFLFFEISRHGNSQMLMGALGGLIIGAIIGLTLEFLNRKQIKDIKKSFSDELPEDCDDV